MPVRERVPGGAPCWIELATSNEATAREFYSALFGWKAEAPSPLIGDYFIFTRQGEPVAGCMAHAPAVGDFWSVYLSVPDIGAALATAQAAGGALVAPAMAVADLGAMAMIEDPAGSPVGLWQAGSFPGLRVLGEDELAGWFELASRDYAGTAQFYEEVLGITARPLCRPHYAELVADGEVIGGLRDIAQAPKEVRGGWSVYFCTEDVARSLARAVALGGRQIGEIEQTPYGQLAQAADPCGGLFKLASRLGS